MNISLNVLGTEAERAIEDGTISHNMDSHQCNYLLQGPRSVLTLGFRILSPQNDIIAHYYIQCMCYGAPNLHIYHPWEACLSRLLPIA